MIAVTDDFSQCIDAFIDRELCGFEMFAQASRLLAQSCRRRMVSIDNGHRSVMLCYNPSRRRSSGADLSRQAIASRPCFLCGVSRPERQGSLRCGDYEVVVNPYPVVARHLTIIYVSHRPQVMSGEVMRDFVTLALAMPGRILFYNGARCGASAPDHLHFQSIPDFRWDSWSMPVAALTVVGTDDVESVADELMRHIGRLPVWSGEAEPRFNLVALPRRHAPGMVFAVVPRRGLRPQCYSSDSGCRVSQGCMVSPASIEMLGLIVTPLAKDFEGLGSAMIERIYDEVAYKMPSTPRLRVGIMSASRIKVRFNGEYTDGTSRFNGEHVFNLQTIAQSLLLRPVTDGDADCWFELADVTIGIDFHWQRREAQRFAGSLAIEIHDGLLWAINSIDIESYLTSVISSEMSSKASIEFLKAHAVISRSWALAQIASRGHKIDRNEGQLESENEIIRWRDRENHTYFDLCADDHCQRYQGLTRIATPTVAAAVEETRGMVLVDDGGKICDARFSKCCGGRFEVFSTCWQPHDYAYLRPGTDIPIDKPAKKPVSRLDLAPGQPLCSTSSRKVLEQVMNNYDCESLDIYRWQVVYTPQQLERLLHERSGIDFGTIKELNPLSRGASGRIYRLGIVGSRRSVVVGKELEIRRWLSNSHLKSSAFDVGRDADGNWVFKGRGWGHGVGLCQVGAAVMALQGYDYRQILAHYFPGGHIALGYGEARCEIE